MLDIDLDLDLEWRTIDTRARTLQSEPEFGKVRLRAQGRLTDRRAALKSSILLSLGQELLVKIVGEKALETEKGSSKRKPALLNILDLCAEISHMYKAHAVRVTIFMCARVAFLCHQLRITLAKDGLENNFWGDVDKKLDEIRTVHATKEARSRVFKKALEADQKLFGSADLHDATHAVPTSEQIIGDNAADGKGTTSVQATPASVFG
ncbi:uncharacterized protein C8Q71DRAFT_898004 [Rhodofomes roseus]|uniref:Uncharacterized protein n=1 Tax=Rhodofomes roseus TaxID=34475 RepID=A0ABQ8KJG8_9APHY|nr:uncharacterized protein C8Q71DRAFT_898004 [Rhodofomes roseus]KAH9837653.1 hypothetical protein C8Q71DRAFT_898004 [Rhodofomes roseus]